MERKRTGTNSHNKENQNTQNRQNTNKRQCTQEFYEDYNKGEEQINSCNQPVADGQRKLTETDGLGYAEFVNVNPFRPMDADKVKDYIIKKFKFEPKYLLTCFADGDNMKAWNSYCGMETTDELMEEAMKTIQSVKPNKGHYAIWLRLKKTGDEFMCYYFSDDKQNVRPKFNLDQDSNQLTMRLTDLII